jgi:hypothetical protein
MGPVITYGKIMAGLISYRGYDYTDQRRAFFEDAESGLKAGLVPVRSV